MIGNQAKLSMSDNESSDHSESFSSRSEGKSRKVLSRQSESQQSSPDRGQLPTDTRYAQQAVDRNFREPDIDRQKRLTQFLPQAERFDFFDFGYVKPMNRWDRFHSCHLEEMEGELDNTGGYMNGEYSRNTPWLPADEYYVNREGNELRKQTSHSVSGFEPSPANLQEDLKKRTHMGLLREASIGSKQKQSIEKEADLESTNDRMENPKQVREQESESSINSSKAVDSPKRDKITPIVVQSKSGRPRMMSEMVKSSAKRFEKTTAAKILRKMKVNSDIKLHKRKMKYKRSFNDDSTIGRREAYKDSKIKMKLEKLVAHWDRKSTPPPSVFFFKSYCENRGTTEVYEEKDHSSKLAQGKLDVDLKSTKYSVGKSAKSHKRKKDKNASGRPSKNSHGKK